MGCQDRHCPSCGVRKTEAWAQSRVSELLDATYFHLVFTVPGELYPVFLANQTALYQLFFAAVAATLSKFSASPRLLGGTPAYFSVLHTTNRRLGYHPHLHVVMAGAGFDEANGKLVTVGKDDFLFPVRALASSFRGRFLSGLRDLVRSGRLNWNGPSIQHLADPQQFRALMTKLYAKNWQVRTDAATGGAERVIRYLSRYTYRTAISNARIVGYEHGDVTYIWRHRATGRRRAETLPLLDFVRRFSRHILPKGFRRVRFYGLLSPGKRGTVLVRAQKAARRRAKLLGFAVAVGCSIQPERQRELCCEACGAEGLLAVAVHRGSSVTILNRDVYARPPPLGGWPARRRAV